MNTAAEVDNLLAEWKAQGLTVAEMVVKLANACLGWAYVFGARGDYCTPSVRRQRYNGTSPGKNKDNIKARCKNFEGADMSGCAGCKWFPKSGKTRCFDCRGFTYWDVLKVTGVKIMGAGATSQWNDDSNWSEKGELKNMPNVVCCVFKANGKTMEHTGLHIGNGQIIHCSNGVQTGKTTDKGWTHYAIPKSLSNQSAIPTTDSGTDKEPETKVPVLMKGSKGDRVIDVQKMLMQLGYSLPKYGADGSFGNETLAAVKKFQQDNGLTVDGKVGAITLAALEKLCKGGTIPQPVTYQVTITDLTKEAAEALLTQYPGAKMLQTLG